MIPGSVKVSGRSSDRSGFINRGLYFDPSQFDAMTYELDKFKEIVDWMAKHDLNLLVLGFAGFAQTGYPLSLPRYSKAEFKNRPLRIWSKENKEEVVIRYTSPNVEKEFIPELIEYAHSKRLRVMLFCFPHYFAGILEREYPEWGPFGSYEKTEHIYCYTNPKIADFFEYLLEQLLTRYHQADAICLHLSETDLCECEECQKLGAGRPEKEAYLVHKCCRMITELAPHMEIHVLDDEFVSLPLEELRRFKELMPPDVVLDWFPHDKAEEWKRVWGDLWWYGYVYRAAWIERVILFPEKIKSWMQDFKRIGIANGYTQAYSFDGFELGYLAFAQYSRNPGGLSARRFWDKAVKALYGEVGSEYVRRALKRLSPVVPSTLADISYFIRNLGKIDYDPADLERRRRSARLCLADLKKAQRVMSPKAFAKLRRAYIAAGRNLSVYNSLVNYLKSKDLADRCQALAQDGKTIEARRYRGRAERLLNAAIKFAEKADLLAKENVWHYLVDVDHNEEITEAYLVRFLKGWKCGTSPALKGKGKDVIDVARVE